MKNLLKIGLMLILGVLIIYPAFSTLLVSLRTDRGFSFENYHYLFTTQGSLEAMGNTLLLGVLTVLVCGLIGTFLAFFVHFFDTPWRRTLDRLLLLPLVVPGLVIVVAFVQLYGESGLVTKTLESVFKLEQTPYRFSGLSGILLVHAYTQYIYFYMNVSLAIKQLDRQVIDAALNLGASYREVFTSVILPYIKPALISASVLTFMTGIGSFSAPSIIGGGFKVLTTQILMSKANMFLELAGAQVMVLVLFATVYLSLGRYYEKRVSFESGVREPRMDPVRIKAPSLRVLTALTGGALVVMILLPVAAIFLLSFVAPGTWMVDIYPRAFSLDNYIRIFTRSRSFQPFANSLQMATLAAVFAAFIAVPTAYITTKTRSRTRPFFEFAVMLPFAMPSSAIAINMITGFSHVLLGAWVLLPLAYLVHSLPLGVRSVVLSYERMKKDYTEASRNLGAGNLRTFTGITLPLIAPGIWAGILLVFIRSLGEYTISSFLYTPSNRPLAIAMVNSMFDFEIGLAMAYGTLVLLVTLVGSGLIRNLQDITR